MRLETSAFRKVEEAWPYLVRILNGGIGFGDGVRPDNVDGVWVSYTSNATPDTQDSVAHTLKRTPKGFLVMSINKAGTVYKSAAFDATNLYLKCNVASTAVVLFVV